MGFYTKRAFSLSCMLSFALCGNAFAIQKHGIDFVVGKDGDFKAAMSKAAAAGTSDSKRFVIFFPDGEYNIGNLTGNDNQLTTFSTSHVSFIGQSADKTVIYNKSKNEGISITATLYFPKNTDIYMQDLTVLNKAIYGNEGNCGSACRHVTVQQNSGDKFIFKNVYLLSGQDTYYTKKGRTYWEGGKIEGTVDFICGDGDVFFEGTKLVMRRSGGYLTASQNSTDWGYVFNNSILEVSNSSYNGSFYLGRSWGHAKTVFLNTIMKAQPKAEGWGPDMNSAPVVFGEYNSKDGNGNAVNTGSRKTRFDGGKDPSTARTLKTVWNASDAAKYTLANVMGGSDGWAPNKLTQQVSAPKITQEGANITWANDDNAMCWVIFVNGSYYANTTSPSIDVGKIATGSKVTVRAANSMGGLGAASNEIMVQDANVTYFNVKASAGIGGTLQVDPNSEMIAEGTKVTFTANADAGWKFDGWTGKNATDAGTETTWSTTMNADIELGATFKGDGSNTFQAESGIIDNAILESSNAGFKGTGYINFNAGASSVKVPVYAEYDGEYDITLTYANGSDAARSLSMTNETGSAQEFSFDKTGNWTTYVTKEAKITLPKGISYITFATLNGNDGPNLDQLELKPNKVEIPADTADTLKDSSTTFIASKLLLNTQPTETRLYTTNGKLVRSAVGAPINKQGLKSGIYLEYTITGKQSQKRIIQVR